LRIVAVWQQSASRAVASMLASLITGSVFFAVLVCALPEPSLAFVTPGWGSRRRAHRRGGR
jgi:hypothetical protein